MAIIFLRSTLIYIVLLIIMRFMGKRQIGEMQPFEFVVTLLIAELACIPMSDVSIPLLYGVSAIFAVFILHQIIALLEHSGSVFKFLVSGKPSIVINKNGVCFKELIKNNMDVIDLLESLRGIGYFSFDSVKYAIYESNGTLSAIENSQVECKSISIILVKNGIMQKNNLKIINYTENELETFLISKGIKLKNLGVLTVDGTGKFYAQEYKSKYITGPMQIKGEQKW